MFLFQLRAAESEQSIKSRAEATVNGTFNNVMRKDEWRTNSTIMVMPRERREAFDGAVKATAANALAELARHQTTPDGQSRVLMSTDEAARQIERALSLEVGKLTGPAGMETVREARRDARPSAATVTLGEPSIVGGREKPLTQSAQKALEIIERYEQQLKAEGNTTGLANLEANLKDQSGKTDPKAARIAIARLYSVEQGLLKKDLVEWSKKAS